MQILKGSVFGLLLLTTIAAGNEPLRIPGGEAARTEVAARRRTTALSKLVESMKPGAWAELKTDMPKGAQGPVVRAATLKRTPHRHVVG